MPEDFEAGVRFVATDEGVSATTEKMGTHFERTTEKMRQTIKQTGYLRLALIRIATYTAIFTFFGVLTKLIGEAISLQTRLAEVSTLVDMRNKQMAESFRVVTRDLLDLSPYLGKATDLTKGLYEIMSAGVTKPVEAFKLLVVSARYAKGGITDLATAASSLTAIMKAYGYVADEMRAKSDMLFASVMEGKYHAEELNQAIGKVLPTAAAMGVQIDEVSAALAVMTQRGLDVNEAATALNRMMLAFMRPIDKAKKEFQKLGWEWGRNAFTGIGLLGVLRRLVEASARYGDILPKIFRRQRALRGAFVLAGEGFKDYVRLLQKIRDATEDGGEVSRAYGKMIGTIAEEVKAAGAKMLRVMYELWEGKGFKWLGGFIRLASHWISVLLKSSRATVAALPFIYALAKAIKIAAVAQAGQISLAKAYTNVLRSMTVAEIKHTATLSAGNKALMVRHKYYLLLRSSLIAGVIAYVAIKTALDSWIASSDRGIDTLHQEARAMEALRDELNLYAAAANQAGEITGDVAKELRALAKADVLKALRTTTKDLELFNKISTAMFEEYRRGSPTLKTLDADINAFLKALREGQGDMTEFNWIIEALARNWGYTTKQINEWVDAQKTSIATMKAHIEGLRFLSRLQRDWNKIIESTSRHVENMARELSKEELEDALKLLQELMTLEKGTPKWQRTVIYLESLGLSLKELTEKELPKFIEKFKEALRVQPRVFREMKYDEFMREYLVIFEKMHPPLKDLEESVRALADTWKTEWVEAYGDSAEVMKLFVVKHRTQLELIKNNLSRLGDFENKVLVEDWIKLLSTRKTALEKANEKAVASFEKMGTSLQDIQSKIVEFENKLQNKRWDNIVVQTKRWARKEEARLLKWVDDLRKAYKFDLEAYVLYIKTKIALGILIQKAEELARKEELDAFLESQRRTLESTAETAYERLLYLDAFYQGAILKLKGFTGISDEEYKRLEKIIDDFFATLRAQYESAVSVYQKWAYSFGFLGKSFTQLTSSLRILDSALSGNNIVLRKGIQTARALAVAFQAVRTAILAVEKAAVVTSTAIERMTAVMSVINAVVGVVSFLFMLFSSLSDSMDAVTTSTVEQSEALKYYLRHIEKVVDAAKELNTVTKDQLAQGAPKYWWEMTNNAERLSGAMDEVGIHFKNFSEYLEQMIHIIEYADQESSTFNRTITALGEAFKKIIAFAERFGLEGDELIIMFIKRLRELGISIQEVDEYVFKWLDAGVEGLNKMIWAAGNTGAELQRLANIALATFSSMIAQGRSWGEALAVMEESLLVLKVRMDALGVSGGEAIDQLLKIALVRRLYSDLFDAIEGNLMVLEALGNTASFFGEEGAKAFADVAEQAQIYYDRLLVAGLTSGQALAIMAPTLQKLQYYAEQYGLVLDANTLKLIEQADALGLLKGESLSMAEILTQGFDRVVEAIETLIGVLTGTDGLSGALDNVGQELNGLNTGAILGTSPKTEILPSSTFIPLSSPVGGELTAVIQIDGRQFYKAVVPYMKKGKKYGDFETDAEEVY